MGEKTLAKNAKVALFVTCLVNSLRPHIGFCCVNLLDKCGYSAFIPKDQTCCGQPAYNCGDWDSARNIAKNCLEMLQDYDYIVIPSGSCAGMIRKHYPLLFQNDKNLLQKAQEVSRKTYELSEFLAICNPDLTPKQEIDKVISVTYHDSCSCLRELKIKKQPRSLLGKIPCIKIIENKENQSCCGFGGVFCIKYSEISDAMTQEKINSINDTGAKLLLSADLGCLLNIAGAMKRKKINMQVRHIAEILAFQLEKTPII